MKNPANFVKKSFRNEIGRQAFKQGLTSKTNLALAGISSIIYLTVLANVDKKAAKEAFNVEWENQAMDKEWEVAEKRIKED